MLVKQAANVIELLEFFAAHQRPATLAEIARHFDWPRSSTFNLLATLTQLGYLHEPQQRGSYYPAPAWAALVQRIDQAQPLPPALQQLLHTLAAETGETAVLAAPSGSDALVVASVESPQAVRYTAPPGKRIPLHVSATGRALLSLMTPEERAAVLRKARFERYTPTTLTSVAAVDKEIKRSIERGWFQGNAEFTPDLGGVAVPVVLPHRHLALLVAGPMFRVGPRVDDLAKRMQGALKQALKQVLAQA